MRKTISLLLFFVFATLAFGLSTKFQENVGKNVKAKIQKAIQEKNLFQDLKSNYYNYASLKFLKSATADLKVCELLNDNKKVKDLADQDAFYYYKFAREAKCDKIVLSAEKNKTIVNAITAEDLDSFYHEIVIGFLYNVFEKAQLTNICTKVLDFIEPNGAAKVTKKKNAESSYENTHKVLNIALSCFEASENKVNLSSSLKAALNNIVLNSLQINKDTRAIYDGKHPVSTTGSILYYVRALSKHFQIDDFTAVFPEFLNYLSEAALGINCPKGIYCIYRALNGFLDFPLLTLDPKPILSKKSVISVNCKNIFGETLATVPKIQGQLSLNNNKIGGVLKFENKSNKFQAELDSAGLTELRFYDLQLTVSDSTMSYSITKPIGITTKVNVQNFKFEVVQSKVAPKILSNEVVFGQIFKETLPANQNSFIHVQFELKFDDKKAVPIKQIAVRLRHPDNRFTTNLVNAAYDGNTHIYKAIIDLGDPDHTMAYNGKYKAELIVADELLIENIKWTFANFDVTFSRPLKSAPLSDIDYTPLPLITHNFPSARNPPPSFITLTFCAAIVGVTLLFLGLLNGLNVNFARFPSTFRGGFFSLLFTLVIFGHVGLLCLFWVKINLIETLGVLVVLFIPTILIGNEGLIALNLEQEVGEVKEIKE